MHVCACLFSRPLCSQARNYGDLEGVDGRAAALRSTLKTQEEVIRNLEALLGAAVDKAKAAAQQVAELKASGGEGRGAVMWSRPAPGCKSCVNICLSRTNTCVLN